MRRALDAEIGVVSEQRERYRQLQLARCQRLVRAAWPKALQDDLDAIHVVTRLLERESRLLGLDAPTTIQVSLQTSERLEFMLKELEAMLEAEGAVDAIEETEVIEGVVLGELAERIDLT